MRQTVTLTLLYAFLAAGPTFEIRAQDRGAQEHEQKGRTRNRQALVAKIREAGITGKMDSYISRVGAIYRSASEGASFHDTGDERGDCALASRPDESPVRRRHARPGWQTHFPDCPVR